MLHCLSKLTKLPIGVEHLQATGIGRTINGMRKQEGAVGEQARVLVNRWKEMVAAEDKSDSDAQEEEANNQVEATSDTNSNTSPVYHKKDKDSKRKESPKEKFKEESTSSSKSKSSSRGKSPEKQVSKSSSKGSDKRKDFKDGESSKSSSKSSRKRHHSQQDSISTAEDEEDEEAPIQSFADVMGSISTVSKKKKSKDKEKHRGEKKKSASSLQPPVPDPPILSKPSLPPPKSLDIRPADFEISPHYKPLPLKYSTELPPVTREKMKTAEEALSVAMAQKGSRYVISSLLCYVYNHYLHYFPFQDKSIFRKSI